LESSVIATPWIPGLLGGGVVMDSGGIAVDGTKEAIFRLKGSLGGARDLVDLGPHGWRIGGDTELYSVADNQLYIVGPAGVSKYINLVGGTGDAGFTIALGADTVEAAAFVRSGLSFGSGSAARDWTMDRTAANVMKVGGGDRLLKDLPGCIVTRSATQAITTATWSPMQYNSADISDPFAMHDPSTNNGQRILALVAGTFLVVPWLGFTASSSTALFAGITINGAGTGTPNGNKQIYWQPLAGSGTHTAPSFFIEMSAGDYFEVMVWHNHGSNLNTAADATCSAYYLGELH
jgi:hypothetical protein